MKERFLVVYDYGQGGVWAFIAARSRSEVERRFPELTVVPETPPWMSRDQLAEIKRTMSFDIDHGEGVLAKILEMRAHPGAAGHGTG